MSKDTASIVFLVVIGILLQSESSLLGKNNFVLICRTAARVAMDYALREEFMDDLGLKAILSTFAMGKLIDTLWPYMVAFAQLPVQFAMTSS